MKKRTFARRDVVLFPWEGKDRTGVVIHVDETYQLATVAYGTRTYREQVSVCLKHQTPMSTAMKFYETTYFYVEHILQVDCALIRPKPNAHCMYGLLFQLEQLYRLAAFPLNRVHTAIETSAYASLQ